MKRSRLNRAWREASAFFSACQWALPPSPRWDITDFGLGDFDRFGLTLVNLAEEPEYCEKIMIAWRNQTTPAHTHRKKKEDIICRAGVLVVQVWPGPPGGTGEVTVPVNGVSQTFAAGAEIRLPAGERVTLVPGVYHAFWAESDICLIGEVSTANDDANDNVFADPEIGRFPGLEEDEPAAVRLISESGS